MTIKKRPSQNEILKKAKAYTKPQPSVFDLYGGSILVLKEKGLSNKEVEAFFKENKITIPMHKISQFIKQTTRKDDTSSKQVSSAVG